MFDTKRVEGTEMVIYSTRRLKSLWKPIPVVCQKLSDGLLWLVAKSAKPCQDGHIKHTMRFSLTCAIPDWATTPEEAVRLKREELNRAKQSRLDELEEARKRFNARICRLDAQLTIAARQPDERMLKEGMRSRLGDSRHAIQYMRSMIASARDPNNPMTATEAFLAIDRQLKVMQEESEERKESVF